MSNIVNLVEAARAATNQVGSGLELVRLDGNEVALIPFTASGESVALHFCEEPDLMGFVHCNADPPGNDCFLCQIKKVEPRMLVPVYQPTIGAIGVLAVSMSFRPRALLPQLVTFLEEKKPLVLFLRREGSNFTVTSADLEPGMDDGAAIIADFQRLYEAGRVRLESVFPRVSNSQLMQMPQIQTHLKYKKRS